MWNYFALCNHHQPLKSIWSWSAWVTIESKKWQWNEFFILNCWNRAILACNEECFKLKYMSLQPSFHSNGLQWFDMCNNNIFRSRWNLGKVSIKCHDCSIDQDHHCHGGQERLVEIFYWTNFKLMQEYSRWQIFQTSEKGTKLSSVHKSARLLAKAKYIFTLLIMDL